MSATSKQSIRRRVAGENVWLSHDAAESGYLGTLPVRDIPYEVMSSEEAIGRAMLEEIRTAAEIKDGSLVIVIVGGRGGQALHRLLGARAAGVKPGHLAHPQSLSQATRL